MNWRISSWAYRKWRTILILPMVLLSSVPNQDDPYSWDYAHLVQEWPQTTCLHTWDQHHKCAVPDYLDYFGIHGLWPERKNGSWPQDCPGPSFNITLLERLENEMVEYWPSLMGPNAVFWEHEWVKHGTCVVYQSDSLTSIYDYFDFTLEMRDFYDMTKILESSGIEPSTDTGYTVPQIMDAVVNVVGFRPLVKCYKYYLQGIWLCFDKDMKIFDCPSSTTSDNCHPKDTVFIPPITRY